jgi:hypothetical protein
VIAAGGDLTDGQRHPLAIVRRVGTHVDRCGVGYVADPVAKQSVHRLAVLEPDTG